LPFFPMYDIIPKYMKKEMNQKLNNEAMEHADTPAEESGAKAGNRTEVADGADVPEDAEQGAGEENAVHKTGKETPVQTAGDADPEDTEDPAEPEEISGTDGDADTAGASTGEKKPAGTKKSASKEDASGTGEPEKSGRKSKLGLLIVCMILVVALIAMVILYISDKMEYRGMEVRAEALRPTIEFDAPEDVQELITDNYVQYLNKAYVLFGTYPDCSYFKVEPGVARDDYDFENDFYTADGETYLNCYKDGQKTGRVGVDVSEYQEEIDWVAVKASGVEVAILRAGFRGYGEEGNMKKDAWFDTNMQNAQAAGLDVGVYFFSQAVNYEEGVEEANMVLSMVEPYTFSQPIIIDTEQVGAEDGRANLISVEDRTEAVRGFCETIEAAGYTPMIYANTYWFVSALDLSVLGKYEFWLAAYSIPQFPYHVEGWQYASDGSVPGINGDVDMNVWLR